MRRGWVVGAAVALSAGGVVAQPAPVCGNGKVEAGERCDDGSGNSDEFGPCTKACAWLRAPEPKVEPKPEPPKATATTEVRPPKRGPAFVEPPPVVTAEDREREAQSLRASLVWSTAGIGLGGALFGPSLPHFAAGERGRALAMTGLRTAAAITIVAGRVVALQALDLGDDPLPGNAAAFIGAAALQTLMLVDLLDGRRVWQRARAKARE